MLSTELFDILEAESLQTEEYIDYDSNIKANIVAIILNESLVNETDNVNSVVDVKIPDLFYRHTFTLTTIYCIAYLMVFAIGLIGNFFVVAVVFRSPRMRTVTNYFIVNLAIADILVIVFCLPATLMSNIFVRKYT